MFLATVNQSIEILTDATATATEPVYVASYADITTSLFTPSMSNGLLNGTTAVEVVAAPAASTQRQIKEITIYNSDSVSHDITVQLDDTATDRILVKFTVASEESLHYRQETGWAILPSPTGGTGVTDHGALTGLSDDDHTQYSLISSQAGAPSTTPSRVGLINIDTTADTVYVSKGTASSADWKDVSSGAGVSDHGALTGLSDDDHTQYSLISSQSGAPGTTPSRVGLINIDTTGEIVYVSKGTASSADWIDVSTDIDTTDHGALGGLGDDDHTQYSLISSQAGAPSSTPSRVGLVNIDTTADIVYVSKGTASSADWADVSTDTDTNTVSPTMWVRTNMSNGTDATNDIDIAAGSAARDDGDTDTMVRSSLLTKRLDAAWAVGDLNGGLDTGTIADTTYHIFMIKRSDTGVVDALFSLSATSPTMPTNYDLKRRIGSIIRSGATILAFSQYGDDFTLSAPTREFSDSNPGTSAVTKTLTLIPTGVEVLACISFEHADLSNTATSYALVTSLEQTDSTPSAFIYTIYQRLVSSGSVTFDNILMHVKTNTSSQMRYRVSFSDAGTRARLVTHGWRDNRGAVSF